MILFISQRIESRLCGVVVRDWQRVMGLETGKAARSTFLSLLMVIDK
jgi:hypothetical protein